MATEIRNSTPGINAAPIAQEAIRLNDSNSKLKQNISTSLENPSAVESTLKTASLYLRTSDLFISVTTSCTVLAVTGLMAPRFIKDPDIAAVSEGLQKISVVAAVIGVITTVCFGYLGSRNLSAAIKLAEDAKRKPMEATEPEPIEVAKPKEEPAITDIYTACKKGDLKALEELVNNGADLNQEKNGWYPLHYACSKGHLPVVEYLVGKGASVNQDTHEDYYLYTPLSLAYENGHCEVVEFLLKKGASPNQTIYDGKVTPLHLTPWKNKEKIAKLLIEHGASLDSQDGLGRTPLHAVKDSVICKVLSDAGSSIYATDFEGRTPRQVALARSSYYTGNILDNSENLSWRKVSVLERKPDGSLPDEKTATTYIYDNFTADLYRQEPSKLKFRAKSLMVTALSPLFIVKTIGSNLIKIVSDIASAVWKSISNFSRANIKTSLKNFAISIIWDAPAAVVNRIYRAVKAPLFGIGMVFAGVYGLYNPKEGRKPMNKIETLWDEAGLLETVGMKKVGNLASSKASPEYAKFLLKQWV